MAGWIRVEADVHRHPRVVALPSAAARWAFIVTLAEGKAVDGRWTSVRHYRACVAPQEARHLPAMVEVGLVVMDGDQVVIHDWDDYQVSRKDPTAAERMRRHRERQRDGGGDASQDRDVTRNDLRTSRAVSLSPSLSPSQPPGEDEPYQVATPPEAEALRDLAEELTGQSNVLANVWSGLGEKSIRLARKHGMAAVEREWRRIASDENGMPELRQLVFGADEALNRVRRTPTVTESPADRDARELAELKALAASRMAAQGATR
jgi:hypothetical protein